MEKDFCRYPLQLGYLKYILLLSISPDKHFFVCNIVPTTYVLVEN